LWDLSLIFPTTSSKFKFVYATDSKSSISSIFSFSQVNPLASGPLNVALL